MPITLIGLVSYADDPTGSVFRKVFPTIDDSELDDPALVTDGLDPTRTAVLTKYPIDTSADATVGIPSCAPFDGRLPTIRAFAERAPGVFAVIRDNVLAIKAARAPDATPATKAAAVAALGRINAAITTARTAAITAAAAPGASRASILAAIQAAFASQG